jgi:hypothetical protein
MSRKGQKPVKSKFDEAEFHEVYQLVKNEVKNLKGNGYIIRYDGKIHVIEKGYFDCIQSAMKKYLRADSSINISVVRELVKQTNYSAGEKIDGLRLWEYMSYLASLYILGDKEVKIAALEKNRIINN